MAGGGAWLDMGCHCIEAARSIVGKDVRIGDVFAWCATRIRAFLQEPVGYLAEKTDADIGWVFPVADEPRVAGYDEQFGHFIACFSSGTTPRETFKDGYVVNTIIAAAYRSMRSGRWERVETDAAVVAA